MIKLVLVVIAFALPYQAMAYEMKFDSAEFLVMPKLAVKSFDASVVKATWNGMDLTLDRKALFNGANLNSGENVYLKARDFENVVKKSEPKFSLHQALSQCKIDKEGQNVVQGKEKTVRVEGNLDCGGIMVPTLAKLQTVTCLTETSACSALISAPLASGSIHH